MIYGMLAGWFAVLRQMNKLDDDQVVIRDNFTLCQHCLSLYLLTVLGSNSRAMYIVYLMYMQTLLFSHNLTLEEAEILRIKGDSLSEMLTRKFVTEAMDKFLLVMMYTVYTQ